MSNYFYGKSMNDTKTNQRKIKTLHPNKSTVRLAYIF
jgi:hypothetical protein